MKRNIKEFFTNDYNFKKRSEKRKNNHKNNYPLKTRNFNFIIIIISLIFISFIENKFPFIGVYCDSKITIIIKKTG